MAKISGIYTITNLIDSKMYVGYATDLNDRKCTHFSTLRNGKHPNNYLQNAYNQHGLENFIFEVIEECEKRFLASQENYWCNMLNTHNDKYGYNIQPTNPNRQTAIIPKERRSRNVDRKRVVLQYDLEGNFIRKYDFIVDAKNFGFCGKCVYECCSRKATTHKKFVFRYEGEEFSLPPKQRVTQYDLGGNIVRVYEELSDVEKYGFYKTNVSHCCNKKYRTCKGFVFRYDDDPFSIIKEIDRGKKYKRNERRNARDTKICK